MINYERTVIAGTRKSAKGALILKLPINKSGTAATVEKENSQLDDAPAKKRAKLDNT